MVKGFTDSNGKFRPTDDRSPFPSQMSSEGLLPQEETKQEEEMQSKRRTEFAKEKARQTGGFLKRVGKGAKQKSEERKQAGIEKSVAEREHREGLDKGIDDIIDDRTSSDSRKRRLLVRFAQLHRKQLNKDQRKLIGDSNRILDARLEKEIQKERTGRTDNPKSDIPFTPTTPNITPSTSTGAVPQRTSTPNLGRKTALTQDQFNKLPENIKVQIRLAGV